MSSVMDPAKLKVVELRAELSQRGLDTKGNKPALVKRLKEALEKELTQELPDTSIADTSTEDLDSSQTEEQDNSQTGEQPQAEEPDSPEKEPNLVKNEQDSKEDRTEKKTEQPLRLEKEETVDEQTPEQEKPKVEEAKVVAEQNQEIKSGSQENGEQSQDDGMKTEDSHCERTLNDEESKKDEDEVTDTKTDNDADSKGEKRKRSTPSPDRSQRRRSRSPIKEDEPPIDNDKVQLSWYDSDLHLQLDKESFLSAKPYHDGAFGYAWAGVRATHGVNSGKVCFEVKLTEELKWEDFSKYYDKQRRDQHKSRHNRSDDEKKKIDDKVKEKEDSKDEAKEKQENEESKNESEQAENGDAKVETTEAEDKAEAMEVGEEEKTTEDKKETGEEEKTKGDEKEAEEEVKNEESPMETEENKEATDEKEQTETKEKAEPLPTHLFRVGWSLRDTALQLGEDKFSYGYESSARFFTDKQFQEYGIKFGVGDVVASFLNIDEENVTITYSVNGEAQPEATTIPVSELPENFAFFPHILSRNYAFELNLGGKEESWFAKPDDFSEYEFLDKIESKIPGPVRPENRGECEVILMCGLPASGKTHWVKEHVQSNPDKKYTLLGNSHLLEKMTVSGEKLKSKFQGSWNLLLEKLQKSLNKLVEIAAQRRRNYIIDQPNVFPSAQRRKLRQFEGFKRRAVIVVVGDEEQAKRQALQEAQDGKDVPDSTVLEMKANMILPQKCDWVEEVVFAELGEEEAKALVTKYNTQGREAGFGIQRRFGHRDDRHRWQNRRNDYRGGNYRERSYHNNRYDRGPPRQNWHMQRPGGGGWNRDRRDNRGPPMGGPREWRNRSSGHDRGGRDSRSQGNNYNRNRNQAGRGSSGSWQSGGNWGQGQGGWNNQAWGGQGQWGQGGWGSNASQNQWKYGGGSQGYGGYSNWNYYGQYPQNWGSQGQTGSTAGANQYGQYSQQEWAQYAQQYAQQGQNTTGSAVQSTTPK